MASKSAAAWFPGPPVLLVCTVCRSNRSASSLLDYQRGSFAVGAPTDVVREIGGREPEDFETIVRRYLARSPFSKRRMALMARAAWNMARAIATPVPDLKALALTLNIPSIPHASLAADSLSWRNSHAAAPVAGVKHRGVTID
jgi:hypothetical protein